VELQGYLTGKSRIPGVEAIPGRGTNIPLYLLGSSLFGAQLAAKLGLPYAFASHFAPAALQDAVAIYRRDFRPSAQLSQPRVLAGVNVMVADTVAQAQQEVQLVKIARVAALLGRGGRTLTDQEARSALRSGAAAHVEQMMTYAAVGTPADVKAYLDQFAKHADADELIVVHQASTLPARLRSVRLTAEVMSQG
jgi:luciferase family oxidoreductase group 1